MSHTALSEIDVFLRHGDHPLAVRRMMDLALDSKQRELMLRAMQLSSRFRIARNANPVNPWNEDLAQESRTLLHELSKATYPAAPGDSLLMQAHGVSKTYSSGAFSMKPTSLDLYAGQILGVVGENGNGKTTLLRCLAGQLAIDSGKISFAGLPDHDFYTLKNRVAFIPQRIPRWYGRLKDNLHFSAAISGVKGEENDLMVGFMLERFGLAGFAELTWNQISSGYRTRFEIARVLLQQPRVLILDEPLANLDIHAQQTLLSDLRFLVKSAVNRMTVLLTSQQLHEVEKAADSVMLIRQGQCIYQTGKTDVRSLGFALELETPATREEIAQALTVLEAQVHFNGGFFTVVSHQHPVQEMIKQLVIAGIPISYCRDISLSTKRLF
ncbi:MAG: ABC transporter ATP-binding protein yadG [Bacteroidetes bacterium]|nr:MAG: ABC transporter ATP-binding protein yadG [Bacteroidota bacterium]